MNVLRNLSGTVSKEPEVIIQPPRMAVSDEPTSGLIRHAEVGMDGVMLTSGRANAFVPFQELFKLVEGKDSRVDLLVKMPRQDTASPPPTRGGRREVGF
jgi:hypothetical protein